MCGEKVKLLADVQNIAEGTRGAFVLWEYDTATHDDFVSVLPGVVREGVLCGEWTYRYVSDDDDDASPADVYRGYSTPEYYFVAHVAGVSATSGKILYKDEIRVKITGPGGRSLAGRRYVVMTWHQKIRRQGTLSAVGELYESDLPPGRYVVLVEPGLFTVLGSE